MASIRHIRGLKSVLSSIGVRAFAILASLAIVGNLSAATVYVVVGADTSSVHNTAGQHVEQAGEREIEFDMTPMSEGAFTTVMSESFRNDHMDSAGDPIKFTWWMLTGGWHQFSTNVDAVAATRVYLENWREESDRWGDEIALHYHHFAWNGSGWVMAPMFHDTLWDFNWSISQLVLDSGVMPVSFRSGWNYMDNPYQQELERWIPFRLEGGSWMSQDVPYHPNFSNFRAAGDMRGWEVRHRYLGSLNQATIDQIFDWAAAGTDQVTCLWSHQYESGFVTPQISTAHLYLQNADASHPGVEFRYVTARDAMRLWQESADETAPDLWFTQTGDRLAIVSEDGVYQAAQPWVAARLTSDEYVRLDATPVTSRSWEIDPLPEGIDLLGVGLCDMMGNATIRELRDGSKRWSSQTEFNSASPEDVDALSAAGEATLLRNAFTAVLEQIGQDGSVGPIERAYWIGQTFVPSKSGLSQVSVGVSVTSGPATIGVELREVDADGFPVMSTVGLLASAEGSIATTGDLLVDLPHSGFVLDGRQYALVFLRRSGDFKIQLHRNGTSPDGNLVRAYSLDWIHIPAFDCRFQTFDQSGQPDQGQTTSDGAAYAHATGRFISQTFSIAPRPIGRVEVRAATATAGDVLVVQLRRTEADGRPDFSNAGLIGTASAAVDAPGLVVFDTDWTISLEDALDPLALTFLSPVSGHSSITLESVSAEAPYAGVYETIDTTTTDVGANLWFRMYQAGYAWSGTLTFDFDSEFPSDWVRGNWEVDAIPPTTSVRARFATADDQQDLDSATWSDWVRASPFDIPQPTQGRWIRAEVQLRTNDPIETPTLHAFEVEYDSALGTAVQGLITR